ncbi:MAG: hypothetical protein N2746_04600 [Deltaproteobacteria bacterium]|nr:hypothetical protein [Deltaproteobacteria bacterium]
MVGISSFCGRWVEICELLDGRIEILWGGNKLSYVETTDKDEYEAKTGREEDFLGFRTTEVLEKKERKRRYKPLLNHPWRKGLRYVSF